MSFLLGIASFVMGVLRMMGLVKQKQVIDANVQAGVDKQAKADAVATVKVQEAEAKAVAQAPTTKSELEDRLGNGTF